MLSNISKKLNFILKTIIYLLLLVLFISFFFIQNNFEIYGALAGKLAIITLWIIAIPGILKRFKVKNILKNIQIVLMLNRRQLGILMFVLVLIHALWSRGFGYILKGPPTSIPTFQLFGTFAYLLSIPLVLTSNDFAVKKLKKWWQRLHYASYLIMFLLIFHTSTQGSDLKIFGLKLDTEYTFQYAIPTILILLVQAASWVYYKKSKNV